MTTALSVRRPRSFNWPLVGFLAAHALAILAMVTLMPIFGSRLPAGTGDFAAFEIRYTLLIVGALLTFTAFRRDNRSSFALETLLPLSLTVAGLGFFALAGTVLINLDAHTYRPASDSLTGLSVVLCGILMSYGFGRYLGSTAAIRRFRREAASSRRFAWLTVVNVDRSWRLLFGASLGVVTALLILMVLWSTPPSPVFAGFLALNWAVGVVAGQQVSVFITDAGIRVSGRPLLGAPSWGLPLQQVASVRVTTAKPTIMYRPTSCILRSGPALEVKSTSGRSYVVSLPDAQEAASLLNRLVEQGARGEIVPELGDVASRGR